MEKEKVNNAIIIEYDLLLARALMLWEKKNKKSFLTCWREALEESSSFGFYAPESHKEVKMPKNFERIALKAGVDRVTDFVALQSFSYLYEVLKDNHKEFDGDDKNYFEKFKNEIVSNSNDNLEDVDKIIRAIRNSLAHNDESGIARVEYEPFERQFTIHFNNMQESITLYGYQLFKLMEVLSRNVVESQSQQHVLMPSLLIDYDIDEPVEKLFRLVDVEKEKLVPPDEHQKEALSGILDRIRSGAFYPNYRLNLFYPFKGNAWNNSVKISSLMVFIRDLQNLKDFDRAGFERRENYSKYYALDDCTCALDEVSLFMSNMLFILCANNKADVLQSCVEDIDNSLNMRRIRNSVIHGTFFHDKKNGFHFYDGKKKTEDDLSYVGYLSFDNIVNLKSNMLKAKFAEYGNNARMTLGTLKNPFPHIISSEM